MVASTDRYASERFVPVVPGCAPAPLQLRFDGSLLILRSPETGFHYRAVSGRRIPGSGFSYSPLRQQLPDQGPIPAGRYWIMPDELWENAWYKPGSVAAWGRYRISIHPYPETVTHGRGGFFIHGGSTPGSAGCIDLSINMDRFVGDLHRLLGEQRLCHIPLQVSYRQPRGGR